MPNRRESPSAMLATQAWGWTSIILGLITVISGPTRYSSAEYFPLEAIPGAPYSWGALFIVAGAAVAVGDKARLWTLRNTGMWALIVAFLGLAGCFLYAGIHDPQASLGQVVIDASIALHLMVLQRLKRPEPPPVDPL
jgi:hypothetical protein